MREIFRRYLELGSVRLLKEELDRRGVLSKSASAKNGSQSGGYSFSRGALYTVLRNPIYVGQIRHKGVCHPGEHEAIVDREIWDKVQTLLVPHRVRGMRADQVRAQPARRQVVRRTGERLTPSHAVKGDAALSLLCLAQT